MSSLGGADIRQRLLNDHDQILTRMRARLARVARARGVAADAVDDVVQESLAEAWRSLDRLTAPDGFTYWVDEICRNVCRRFTQRRTRDVARLTRLPHTMEGQDEELATWAETLSAGEDPALDTIEAASREDMATLLDRALGLLSDEARRLIELVYLCEIPHLEAAARLGVSSGTLDTRLSRARRRLYDALNGPLRSEAAELGLTLDEARGEGWVETRLWCSRCGACRLQGAFMRGENPTGGPNLHLRCPACARRYGQDTLHTMGLASLGSASSFRPAWKRAMQGLTNHVTRAIQTGELACWCCGGVATVEVCERATAGAGDYPYYVRMCCARCGRREDTTGDFPAVDQLTAWSHPVARQFLLEHERWTSAFDDPVERYGALVIPIILRDSSSAARLTILAERQTLRVVALA